MALIASTRERPFGSDELFGFAVDPDGRLRAVDPVFARLSGFGPGDSVDALRHPDVPLAVLRSPFGAEPGAAYLRLVADDGSWLKALVIAAPVRDGWVATGFKPGLPEPEAGRELRGEDVTQRLADYATAMRAAVVAEVAARAPHANELLDAQARRLAGYAGLSEDLRRKSAFVVELAESIRLFSLNAILAAHRVRDAAAIGAVAGLMKTRSDAAGPEILALADDIEAAAGLLEAASFRVAVGRVQAEALPGAPWVAEALAVTLDDVADTTVALDAALDALAARSYAVEEHLKTLRFLELQGRIEAARSNDTEHVRGLFEEIGVQVRTAGEELVAFSALATRRDRDGAEVAREARRQAAALRT
jgi:aerotaxis receptor